MARPSDRYGLALSTGSVAAAEHYVDGLDRLLALDAGAEDLLQQALDADPGFALAHVALAMVEHFGSRPEAAGIHLARAGDLMAGTTAREQRHLRVATAAVDGDVATVRELGSCHLDEFPRDALVLLLVDFALFFGGDKAAIEATLDGVRSAYGDDWFFLGLLSFHLHEAGQYQRSASEAERSLARNPRNSQAVHSLTHVHYETGELAAGVAFLERWLAGYPRQAPQHCHLWWHVALCEMAMGRPDRVAGIYTEMIDPPVSRSASSVPDATSILWRWQLYGCGPGMPPWDGAAAAARRAAGEPGFSFVDAHAALALAAVADEAALARLEADLRGLGDEGHPTASAVVLPLVRGLSAYAKADHEAAVLYLEPACSKLVDIGGSHAQREVFEDTLVHAYIETGRLAEAVAMLGRRFERHVLPRERRWMEQLVAAGAAGPMTDAT